MKFPWIKFFPGDWLKEPSLTICSPATRGVWIDLLCVMHESGRASELRGTTEQLARLARCLPADLTHALTELQTTGAADVSERNGIVTLVCRRLKKEENAREYTRLRVSAYRGNAPVTLVKRSCNGDISEVRGQKSEGGGGGLPVQHAAPPPTPHSTPYLEKMQGWQLRKDLEKSTDPAERAAIKAEIKRREVANRKPQAPKPTQQSKPTQPQIPFEKRKELWEQAKNIAKP